MIHDRLKEVYDEFDRYCRTNNIDYSIDADYYNVQAYRLLGRTDVPGVLQHISNYVKDRWVDLEYDGFPVDYTELKNKNFSVATINPLFKFTLKPLQEDDMINEDSMKNPTNAHGRKQAAFPSSFRKHKTRDTYEEEGTPKKKKKKKKKKTTESLDRTASFEDRLLSSINEQTGLSIIEPDILLTRNPAEQPSEDEDEMLDEALQAESIALQKYLSLLEHTEDEKTSAILEELAERCAKQINTLNAIRERKTNSN